MSDETQYDGSEIAIIGMACRFPGASTPEAFWRNLVAGVESLTTLSEEELLAAGVPREALRDPRYVPRAGFAEGIEYFDPAFFGYTPLEAKIMDPQHRLFLECAWEAFEHAGYNPEGNRDRVGVFTGAKTNTYLFSLFSNRELFRTLDSFQLALGNDLAAMATRISFKFNLRGPSYGLHTACSTSLVAVHLACQSLLLGECRMALAGGSAVNIPYRTGYLYQKGGILSPDGSCRTFDERAQGSNFSNGSGAVLLKRLEDALADGDHVHAIIRGTASNNDGSAKASFTAPGVEGQTDLLIDALACAGVDADTLSYVEAHGTGTDLGDTIEMLALTEAFRASTPRRGFCAIGSVKTNLGHLEVAAGVAGLIKTALALEHRQIPPSLHYEKPNPRIDFESSPFYVATRLTDWQSDGPRRAGVSSFGIGSTNAHVILEEPPPAAPVAPSRPWQLLLLSARSEPALNTMTANLARRLESLTDADLPDVAYTLQTGRKDFGWRRAVLCRGTDGLDGAVAALSGADPERVLTHLREPADLPVAFLFPGLGDHHAEMGLGLYRSERVFREELDRCAELLRPHLGVDLREVLYPRGTDAEEESAGKLDLKRMLGRGEKDTGPRRIDETWLAHPALFAVEYALARLWMSWGIVPQSLVGYSLGEYVAACLAGVLELPCALALVARRARLIQDLEPGAMLAVSLPEAELVPHLESHGLSLAAVNGPAICVAAGPVAAVETLERDLGELGVACRRLPTHHAFHSSMMESLSGPLTELVRTFKLSAPAIPYISNVTGTWITPEQATDPEYWARHTMAAVRFADGVRELLAGHDRILLEVGPGQGLSSFVKQLPECDADAARLVFPSMRSAYARQGDLEVLLGAVARVWLTGRSLDWPAFWQDERRRRVPLPAYPFERQRYWVDPVLDDRPPARRVTLDKQTDMADWFYRPVWSRSERPDPLPELPRTGWLLLADREGLGEALAGRLRSEGHDVTLAFAGAGFAEADPDSWSVDPSRPQDYDALLAAVSRRSVPLTRVVHLWSAPPLSTNEPDEEPYEAIQDAGFYSLIHLAQALGRRSGAPVHIDVVSSQVQSVRDGDSLVPEKATLLGPCRVIPQEIARLTCRSIDVAWPNPSPPGPLSHPLPPTGRGGREEAGGEGAPLSRRTGGDGRGDGGEGLLAALVDSLRAELALSGNQPGDEPVVAWRGGERFVQDFQRERMEEVPGRPARLRDGGVYLLTGGLGGLGLAVAEHLARTVHAKLVLTGRSPFPPREEWDGWLQTHGEEGDATSRRIRQLLDLEELGAEVLALSADVTDEKRMAEVIAAARQRFGALHGVIHLAGTPGGGILQLKTREAAARIVSPKVEGARVLDRLLADQPLDFFVCFSSIASILGEFGQADYCGANAFLDAFAQRNARRGGPPFLTIDWDIWSDVGLAVHTEVPAHLRPWRQEMLQQAIRPAEGTMAFRRLLERALGRVPQVVVSAQDLHGRIELGKSFTGESFLAELEKLDHGHGHSSHGEQRPARRVLGTGFVAAAADGSLERRVAEVWQRVLGVEQVGLHDNFFDLGGNSLLGLQLVSEIGRDLGVQVAPVTLFESPTVAALTRQIQPEPEADAALAALAAANAVKDELAERRRRLREGGGRVPVAIIGMAGRFPGAGNVEELWENLRDGVESVTFFSDDELRAAGVPEELLADPRYVRAGSVLEGIDQFDAGLFGYSPREAEVMDPQHRIFLESAWETLERAGYDPSTYAGSIGVFAGSNLSTYLLQLYGDPDVKGSVNMLQAILGNDKDSLTTTVSYKLNLRGPSVAVQTFCSTSLVAVHMACRSLRTGECDMALAGGIRVVTPDHQGYLYEQGGIAPSDGHSRSFDAKANGSILGHGVGIVCLKRLDDALADGDPIHAVILGSAINNDGSLKAGYTAPSVAGQADAVMAAYEDAGVSPEDLSYVEAHGSATELGDPIEVTALTKAFRTWTDRRQYIPIGSVKANFGHLDRAAGVTGLIKTVLAMQHEEIPPNILFDEPNPKIDFAGSPFFVNTERRPWPSNPTAPRRAGVNSLGMGGTNVHVIVEEAPRREPSGPSRPWQLLLLSARTPAALDRAAANLAGHLEAHPDLSLADAAFTLQVGRRALEHRRAVVVRDVADARAVLEGGDPRRVFSAWCEDRERGVVFLFSGMGGQYPDMGRGLYESEATFKKDVDRCAEILQPLLGVDLRELMYPAASSSPDASAGVDLRKMLRRSGSGDDEAAARLNRTRFAQPALFVLEYALARLWMEWGVRPQAMMGYSLGEYVAACLAGVFSLEDALALVAERARLIEELPEGAMLAVSLPEAEAAGLVGDELSLAAVNGPEQSVLAGPLPAVEALEGDLAARGIACRRLQTTHAFHSKMMEPIRQTWAERVGRATLRPPQIPYISNVTGAWITPGEATDPAFWAGHTCQPVRFSEGIAELRRDPDRVLLEIGPGATLASLVLQHPASKGKKEGEEALVVAALRHSYETQPDVAHALTALGKLWLAGVRVDWSGFYARERRHRLVLPTYPFERQRYWIDTVDATRGERRAASRAAAGEGAHLYLPSWKRAPRAAAGIPEPGRWLVFADGAGVGETLAERLRGMGSDVALVHAGQEEEPFTDLGGGDYRFDPRSAEAHAALLETLGEVPGRIVHLLGISGPSAPVTTPFLPFQSLAALAGALVGRGVHDPLHLWVIGDELHEVSGEEEPSPERSALLGAVKAIPRELPQVACRAVDITLPGTGPGKERLLRQLLTELAVELAADSPDRLVALRGNHRWAPAVDPLEKAAVAPIEGGLWLLSAGLGEAGFAFARELAGAKAKLLLLEPAGFPAREEWSEWLEGDAEGVVGHLLRNARTLEEQGAELEVVGVDLADGARLREVVEAAEARWGGARGAVWVAEPGTSEGHLAGALTGLRSLDAVLATRDLTSALLVVPEGAPGAEAAALGFLADAFATGSALAGSTPWTSVAWALSSEEGAAAAARRLLGGTGALHVLASPRPLPEGWSRLEAFLESESTARTGVGYYPRPSLRVEYVAPRNETEEYIARIWKDLLGVAQVGIHDNFLDLGGDSLLATRLVARMRDTFHLDLPVRLFFEKSTVAELAEAVSALRQQEQERETQELLAKIQNLSEEELEQELLRMEGLIGEEEPARGVGG